MSLTGIIFGQLVEEIVFEDNAIVDIGASNVERFLFYRQNTRVQLMNLINILFLLPRMIKHGRKVLKTISR